MTNVVYIATSLDGYIATEDGDLSWLTNIPNLSGSDYGFNDFLDSIDAILMGRKTFDTIKNFTPWPYSKKVFVLSNSIKYVNSELNNKVSIVNGDIKSVLSDINKKGFIRLYIDGGKTIQSFLELNLIDELIITKAPVLLGRGIPLFNKLSDSIQFQHLKTEVLDNTFVKSHYIRNKTNMHL